MDTSLREKEAHDTESPAAASAYDDAAVAFSKDRLTRIARDTPVIDYAYDRFGREVRLISA